MKEPKSAAVIGFGRFGQLWASILKEDFSVQVHDTTPGLANRATEMGVNFVPLKEALASDVIFYCVPISLFEKTLASHASIFAELSGNKTLIDVLSVKLHPKEVFEKHLSTADARGGGNDPRNSRHRQKARGQRGDVGTSPVFGLWQAR